LSGDDREDGGYEFGSKLFHALEGKNHNPSTSDNSDYIDGIELLGVGQKNLGFVDRPTFLLHKAGTHVKSLYVHAQQ
jgi:hypothetical protein